MPAVDFPALVPSSRSYQPGVFPETRFEAQNGAVVRVRYGNQRTNSRLTLTFSNIADDKADLVLENNGAESELEEKLKEALEDLQTLED